MVWLLYAVLALLSNDHRLARAARRRLLTMLGVVIVTLVILFALTSLRMGPARRTACAGLAHRVNGVFSWTL